MNLALICVVLLSGAVAFSDDESVNRPAVRTCDEKSQCHALPIIPVSRPDRCWVFFTDKAVTDETALNRALEARRAELSPRALQRRALRRTAPGLLDIHDLPVPQRYIDAVANTGARVRRVSRWLNAVSVDV